MQSILSHSVDVGFQELRFKVYSYGVMNASKGNVIETIRRCMDEGFHASDTRAMFSCWSSASIFFRMPKSADLASVCPFHYNHWYTALSLISRNRAAGPVTGADMGAEMVMVP